MKRYALLAALLACAAPAAAQSPPPPIRNVQINGTNWSPPRPTINFVGASYADNPTDNRADITVGGGGGGSVFSVTGTSPITCSPTTGAVTCGHATSGISAATYGSASAVPVCAYNATGHATSCSNTSIAIGASQVTSGTLPVARGGTNATSGGSLGSVACWGSGNAYAFTAAPSSTHDVLHGTPSGTGVATWGQVALDTEVSGTLPIANGGTGSSTRNFVQTTGDETVAGIKTFSSTPVALGLTATPTPTGPGYLLFTDSGTATGDYETNQTGIRFQLANEITTATNLTGWYAKLNFPSAPVKRWASVLATTSSVYIEMSPNGDYSGAWWAQYRSGAPQVTLAGSWKLLPEWDGTDAVHHYGTVLGGAWALGEYDGDKYWRAVGALIHDSPTAVLGTSGAITWQPVTSGEQGIIVSSGNVSSITLSAPADSYTPRTIDAIHLRLLLKQGNAAHTWPSTITGATLPAGIGPKPSRGTGEVDVVDCTYSATLTTYLCDVRAFGAVPTWEPYSAFLAAQAALGTNGLVARTGSGTAAARSVACGSSTCTVANADGSAGNPTVTVASTTINGTTCTPGGSCSPTATATNALTLGTGLGGTSYNGSSPVTASVTYGTSSGTATQGNDTRLLPAPSAAGKVCYDTGSAYACIAAGSSGQCLKSGGAGAPTWGSCSAGGTDATSLQGVAVSASAPSDTNVLCYSSGSNQWQPCATSSPPAAGTAGNLQISNGSAWASVAMSGDATIAGSGALTLANSGVSAATYGSATQVPVCAIDAKGRATSCTNTSIAIAASQVTSGQLAAARGGTGQDTSASTGVPRVSAGTWSILAALTAALGGTGLDTSASTGVPSISAGTWSVAARLSAALGGTGIDSSASTGVATASAGTWSFLAQLSVALGGTGQATLTNHGVLVGAGTSAITQLAAAAAGTLLAGQGASSDPAFTATPTLGVAGTTLGSLGLAGNTSGTVTIKPQAAAGTYNFNLPTGAGTSGQPLLSGGGGTTAQTYGTLGTTYGGTGQDFSACTGVPTLSSGTASCSSLVPVARGGTNASSVGSAGSLAYSSGGTSYGFSNAYTSGYVWTSGGTGAPVAVQTVPIANGGTNATAVGSAGSIPYSSGGTSYGFSSAYTSGYVWTSGGTGAPVAVQSVPVANGGTGLTSCTTGDLNYCSASNTVSALALGTAGRTLVVNAGATAPTWGHFLDLYKACTSNTTGGAAANCAFDVLPSGLGSSNTKSFRGTITCRISSNGSGGGTVALTAGTSGSGSTDVLLSQSITAGTTSAGTIYGDKSDGSELGTKADSTRSYNLYLDGGSTVTVTLGAPSGTVSAAVVVQCFLSGVTM